MASPILLLTAVESGVAFVLTIAILYLVLSRGTKAYHRVFAIFLLICANWDAGIFLAMVRNDHLNEVALLGRLVVIPCVLMPALIVHFMWLYLRRPTKRVVVLVWGLTAASVALILAGYAYRIEGVYAYEWGNIFKVVAGPLDPLLFLAWFAVNLPACWLLCVSARRSASRLERRHLLYMSSVFLVVTLAIVKTLVTMGIDVPLVLPLGMLFNDVAVIVLGVAITSDRLLDITFIVKKGTLYSLLAGLLLFLYSVTEHVLITYVGKVVAEESSLLHFFAIAVGIAILIPVKSRLERGIDGYFAHRRVEF